MLIYRCHRLTVYVFLFLVVACSSRVGINGVRINKLQVPEITQPGAPVVLDCDFTLEDGNDNRGLVVKWFFNKKPRPVYQWIPGSSTRPQDLGILKGRLNLEYSASEDERSIHRALHILKPGPELSGEYTCLVSTFLSEDSRTKSMLVFVPERSLELRREMLEEGIIRVMCSAEGTYPKPEMILRIADREVSDAKFNVRSRAGLYDISGAATLPALTAPEEFACELRIPQANYTVRREAVFYPGGGASSVTALWCPLVPCLLLWIMELG